MRALFVTGSLGHGGAERHSITLINRLADRGHECHAVYVKNDPSQLERLRGAASARCLHARRYLDLGSLRELSLLIRRIRPTVIVAANPYALMYASLARRGAGAGAPLAVTFHSTLLQSAKERLQMLCYRPLFWAADCLVFVCDAQRRHWLRRKVWGRRNDVIYNGVDPDHWRPSSPEQRSGMRRALGYAEKDFVVGICAVLRPEKNHVQLVDAIAALRARAVPARALVIGDGPTRPAIAARARAAGVAGEVLITGFQQDVRPMLLACDVAALCSATETFSLAALEAMALARPMVHSDVGGASEMIRPGKNGFLFPVGDTAALVERLAALTAREACMRMGAAARETVEAHFSERAMVDRYETMLTELDSARSSDHDVPGSARAY